MDVIEHLRQEPELHEKVNPALHIIVNGRDVLDLLRAEDWDVAGISRTDNAMEPHYLGLQRP